MFEIELIIRIKMDLALNKQQRLICHKTRTTNQPYACIGDVFSVKVIIINGIDNVNPGWGCLCFTSG